MWTITGTNWTLTPRVLFLFLGLPEFKATLLPQGLLGLGANALRDSLPAGFPELPLRVLPVFERRGSINRLAISEPVPIPVDELHDFPLRRLSPESDLTDTKPFPVGQFEEADPERVFEKNGQRALAQAFSTGTWMMVSHLSASSWFHIPST